MKTVVEMSKKFLFALLCAFGLAVVVHSQDQSGFISLDCGLPAEDSNYIDVNTGIDYISDATFIDTGASKTLSPEFITPRLDKQLWYVRSFPENIRNCYTIKVRSGSKYLIRATFMYGNYDSRCKVPVFELHLGANLWSVIAFINASTATTVEIVHVSYLNYIQICLVNIYIGTPFISTLELRPLKKGTYVTKSGSLMLLARLDMGSTTNQTIRYKDDVYDRIWRPYNFINWTQLSTTASVKNSNDYHPPESVMNTASTPKNSSEPLLFYFETVDPRSQFYFYLHFAEVENLQANRSREFNIFLNGNKWFGPVSPKYLDTTTVYSTTPIGRGRNYFWIIKTKNSTLPPILNAVEAYVVREFLQSQTNQSDVDAITKIKSFYGVKRNWQGDPCAPLAYTWHGLKCSYNKYDAPRIVSLNLSSSGLTGNIAPEIINLALLQSIDLSNNSLTGSVPEFLAKLPFLRFLNLAANNFAGLIPVQLIERSKNGSLIL